MQDLHGKRILVLGGTQGMGRRTAELAISRGAEVIVTGASPSNIAEVAQSLPGVTALRIDLADESHVDAIAGSLGARQLDALLVFAAIAELAPLDKVNRTSFDRQFAVNFRGIFFALQHLVPRLKDGGSVTLATVTPATATPTMGVYMATKAALGAYGRTLAAELLGHRIRVNLLAPGFIDTPTLGMAGLTEAERAEMHAIGDAITPMGRHGTMDEIARAAMFLAFDATFCTGVELAVDGGLSSVDAPSR